MTIIEIIEKLDQLIGLLVDILSLIITGHETEVICIITILLINVILLYYYITKCQKIKLYFTKTPLNNFITQNSTALNVYTLYIYIYIYKQYLQGITV